MNGHSEEFDVVVENLYFNFDGSEGERMAVLADISLSVRRGSLFCIVGPSGCGKTTLLRILLGDLEPTSGRVKLEDSRALGGLAYISQAPNLLPWRTLKQNAALGTEVRGRLDRADIEFVEDLIRKYGLEGFEECKPDQLSGGMQQRTAVIRALSSRPQILFCDEPFSSVDFVTRLALNTQFKKMCSLSGATTVFVTHNIEEAIFLGDTIAVMGKCPAEIVATHEAKLSIHPEDAVLCRRSPEFVELFDSIWSDLGRRR